MLALTETQEDLWWGAVIGGFMVVLAVAALLTILVLLVRRIDQRVVAVRDSLQAAAANTADTALLAETAAGVEAVLSEGLKHHLFLGRVRQAVRSLPPSSSSRSSTSSCSSPGWPFTCGSSAASSRTSPPTSRSAPRSCRRS